MTRRRYDLLRRIESLDPVADHQEIQRISVGYEFPWDYRRALEFALFRTYCVPSISALLDATGEFAARPQRRYDDTALLMAELVEHGYDSPRGREALRVVNRAHGRYRITNDDMLYVLTTFVHDPIDWIDDHGWRPLSENERLASFHFYRAVGKRMGITAIPDTSDELRQYKVDYERDNFRYSDTNRRIGEYTRELFCSWYPAPLRPAVRHAVHALVDPAMSAAFGFPVMPAWTTRAGKAALRARGEVVRLLPPRRRSRLAADPRNRTYPSYPNGYRPADLGAPPLADVDPTWLAPGRRPDA
ncbi:oxygenase MpaB family protein [Umezawaea sp. Da 62-37]|uniref:oxygenase MpaB family protein n=1 Tax=Umezawaea sp. Da 62-37 TaxID=3075927 RepID=UPI0028F7438E|nr:oxygenase MpaB family protein [Umezawaea sp. Da 62-37]WNV88375.1 oxygenase MpaB family protein [Umezawaea sp. Da 62-37]